MCLDQLPIPLVRNEDTSRIPTHSLSHQIGGISCAVAFQGTKDLPGEESKVLKFIQITYAHYHFNYELINGHTFLLRRTMSCERKMIPTSLFGAEEPSFGSLETGIEKVRFDKKKDVVGDRHVKI